MSGVQPTVARSVHLEAARIDDSQVCVAAIVTDIHTDGTVDLALFPPAGVAVPTTLQSVREEDPSYARGPQQVVRPEAGTWHWPEGV